MPAAVSDMVKDIVIPLIASAITAAGIIVPLLFQRLRDRRREEHAYSKALRSIHRDAAVLVEQVQLAALYHHQGEPVSTAQLTATESASARLFGRLFDDPRIFDSYFHRDDKPAIENETKLLLLLGEFEGRLKRLASPDGWELTLFAAYLVLYYGEEDEATQTGLRESLRLLAADDLEARTFATTISPDLVAEAEAESEAAVSG